MVRNLLQDDPVKTIAFVRHRNFGITEIELEEVLNVLTGQRKNQRLRLEESRELLKLFPEVYPILNKAISQINFSSAEKIVY